MTKLLHLEYTTSNQHERRKKLIIFLLIIGSLLIEAKQELIDVNVLMAVQLLVELAQTAQDPKFLSQIHHR